MVDGKVFYECSNGVFYNQMEGSIIVTFSNIQFIKLNCTVPILNIKIIDIKLQRVSPPTSKKVQLQIIMSDDGHAHTFLFHNTQQKPEYNIKKRDELKIILAKLLPLNREKMNNTNLNMSQHNFKSDHLSNHSNIESSTSNNDNTKNITKHGNHIGSYALLSLEEKKKLLLNNRKLYQMYKEFVANKIIEADDFWRYLAVEPDVGNLIQRPGLESNFWSTLVPETKGCNELVFSLSKEKIEAIFVTYPSLKSLYQRNVPQKMSQEEFWKLFLQAQFFNKDNTKEMKEARAFFKDAIEHDLMQIASNKISNNASLYNNLSNFESSYTIPRKYDGDIFKDSCEIIDIKNIRLLNKCNLHSKTILELSQRKDQPINYNRKRKMDNIIDDSQHSNCNHLSQDDIFNCISYDDLIYQPDAITLSNKKHHTPPYSHNILSSFTFSKLHDNDIQHSYLDLNNEQVSHEIMANLMDTLDNFYNTSSYDDNAKSHNQLNIHNNTQIQISTGCHGDVYSTSQSFDHPIHDMIDNSTKQIIFNHYGFINGLIDRFWLYLTKRYKCSKREVDIMCKCLTEYRKSNLPKLLSTNQNLYPMGDHIFKMIDSLLTNYHANQKTICNETSFTTMK